MAISPRRISTPILAASSEPRPSNTVGRSYPKMAILAISLPGSKPAGTVCNLPHRPCAASQSIAGVSAACMGVRPPNEGIGSSAIPSPKTIIYFITSYIYRILAIPIISANTPAAVTGAPAPYPLIIIGYSL